MYSHPPEDIPYSTAKITTPATVFTPSIEKIKIAPLKLQKRTMSIMAKLKRRARKPGSRRPMMEDPLRIET
jgi:hypothetical protein